MTVTCRQLRYSLSQTVNHDKCGQTPAKQKHQEEKEGGGGGAKRLVRWPTVLEECHLRREDTGLCSTPEPILGESCRRRHLLAVEQDDELDGINDRKQGAKQGTCPNHSLTINQPQDIGRHVKLLPTQPPGQPTGPVVHHNPDVGTQNTSGSCRQAFYLFPKVCIVCIQGGIRTCEETPPGGARQCW